MPFVRILEALNFFFPDGCLDYRDGLEACWSSELPVYLKIIYG